MAGAGGVECGGGGLEAGVEGPDACVAELVDMLDALTIDVDQWARLSGLPA